MEKTEELFIALKDIHTNYTFKKVIKTAKGISEQFKQLKGSKSSICSNETYSIKKDWNALFENAKTEITMHFLNNGGANFKKLISSRIENILILIQNNNYNVGMIIEDVNLKNCSSLWSRFLEWINESAILDEKIINDYSMPTIKTNDGIVFTINPNCNNICNTKVLNTKDELCDKCSMNGKIEIELNFIKDVYAIKNDKKSYLDKTIAETEVRLEKLLQYKAQGSLLYN